MLLTKSQERRIIEVIRLVHEHRLAASLAQVEEALRAWHEGLTPIFSVDDAIRQHTMRSKRYFALYANTPASSPAAVGILDEAVELGIISKEEYERLIAVQH